MPLPFPEIMIDGWRCVWGVQGPLPRWWTTALANGTGTVLQPPNDYERLSLQLSELTLKPMP
jgi:hypothetical protein